MAEMRFLEDSLVGAVVGLVGIQRSLSPSHPSRQMTPELQSLPCCQSLESRNWERKSFQPEYLI